MMSYSEERKFTCVWGLLGGPGSCRNLICSSSDDFLALRGVGENDGEGIERAFIHRGKSVHLTGNIFFFQK